MVNDHYIRKYTEVGGRYPFNWRVVGEGTIAIAAVKTLRYFRKKKKELPEESRHLYDLRVEKNEFDLTYHFGGSSVVFDDLGKAPLTIEGASKKALEILLKVTELKSFEPKRRASKRNTSH